jgi:hypothetical protein
MIAAAAERWEEIEKNAEAEQFAKQAIEHKVKGTQA